MYVCVFMNVHLYWFVLSMFVQLSPDKEIDLNTVDLSKLRVKELRKILGDMGGSCNGCLEKDEFIRRIKDLHGKTEL